MLMDNLQDNQSMLKKTRALVRALKNADLYDHPVSAFSIIETHISWIILTGTYAYKIKKPVDFGFIDFSTLDKRKFYCEEELRLNRRFSDNLYLKVIAIRSSNTHPRLNGEGKIIEYAVQMKEFPQNMLISNYASKGLLTADHIDSMAQVVADFHSKAPCSLSSNSFGNWDTIVKWNHENFPHLEKEIPEKYLPDYYQSLKNWCLQQEETLKPVMQFRHQNGSVRECHGDLHLGNMVLQEDQCTPFDCLEFNDELRWIDPISEIAFVVMDLQAQDYDEYAWRFLNRYLAINGDYDGVSLLAYYIVYRALVRAKVEALSIAHRAKESFSDNNIFKPALHYLDATQPWINPQHAVLIVMHGLSGSGKSTVAGHLASKLGAIHIRSDIERKRLYDLVSTADSGSSVGQGIYTEGASQKTYSRLAELAQKLVENNFSVIVDATCLKSAQRGLFRQTAQRLDVPSFLISCQAPEKELRQRISQRLDQGGDASEANQRVLTNQLKNQEPLSKKELKDSGTILCHQPQLNSEQLKIISNRRALH